MTDERGRWIQTCGCGAETFIRNQAFVTYGERCERDHPSGDMEPSVPMEAGWCGCGEPERVDALMLAYLEAVARRTSQWMQQAVTSDPPEVPDNDANLLLAYVASELEWTEHGGTVGGAWISDDGQIALERLRAAQRAEVPA